MAASIRLHRIWRPTKPLYSVRLYDTSCCRAAFRLVGASWNDRTLGIHRHSFIHSFIHSFTEAVLRCGILKQLVAMSWLSVAVSMSFFPPPFIFILFFFFSSVSSYCRASEYVEPAGTLRCTTKPQYSWECGSCSCQSKIYGKFYSGNYGKCTDHHRREFVARVK